MTSWTQEIESRLASLKLEAEREAERYAELREGLDETGAVAPRSE